MFSEELQAVPVELEEIDVTESSRLTEGHWACESHEQLISFLVLFQISFAMNLKTTTVYWMLPSKRRILIVIETFAFVKTTNSVEFHQQDISFH